MPYYQPGDIILRDYKIEAFIGQGGFGEVYRAVDLNLHEHQPGRWTATRKKLPLSGASQQRMLA